MRGPSCLAARLLCRVLHEEQVVPRERALLEVLFGHEALEEGCGDNKFSRVDKGAVVVHELGHEVLVPRGPRRASYGPRLWGSTGPRLERLSQLARGATPC